MKRAQEAKRQAGRLDRNGGIFAIEDWDFELCAQNVEDIAFGNVTQIDENSTELIASFLLKR